MAKICRLIFSSNRLEFLIPTLSSHEKNINFGHHDVTTILIDDYPLRRFDDVFIDVAKKYGVNQLILHEENQGLTKTWTEAWNYISKQDFDYVWHHEDDVVFLQPILIDTLINFLNNSPNVVQVNLKRNPWYDFELEEPAIRDNDSFFLHYRYNLETDYFWTMCSLYPTWVTKEPIIEREKCNLAEYPVMKYFREVHGKSMAILKNMDGSNMVNHIGVYSQGKRVLENEPGWDKFKTFDPLKRYDSKTGALIE